MKVKDFIDKTEGNISVLITRPSSKGLNGEWLDNLYEGMLYSIPAKLQREEIMHVEENPYNNKTVIIIKKTREKYHVNVLFDGDMEDAIKNRAGQLGIGVGRYIKMLVAKDLEEAK